MGAAKINLQQADVHVWMSNSDLWTNDTLVRNILQWIWSEMNWTPEVLGSVYIPVNVRSVSSAVFRGEIGRIMVSELDIEVIPFFFLLYIENVSAYQCETKLFKTNKKCLGIKVTSVQAELKIATLLELFPHKLLLMELQYTVGTESIQTPLNFSLFVILQPFAKII